MKKYIIAFCLLMLCFTTLIDGGVVANPACQMDLKAKDFPFVGGIYNKHTKSAGSAVVIGLGEFIITARHCVTTSLDIAGDAVCVDDIVFIVEDKNYAISQIVLNPDADLAICRLVEPHTSSVKMFPYLTLSDEFYGVGVGRGASKINYDKLDFDLPYGTKRVFKNEMQGLIMKTFVDELRTERKFVMYYYMLREKSFFENQIMGEGMQGPGDSGGGLFLYHDQQIKLIGIISSVSDERPIAGFAVELTTQKEWIESVVANTFSN